MSNVLIDERWIKMEKIIRIGYKKEPSELKISLDGKMFDVSRIEKMQVQEWAFPFCIKGVKWNGLFDELKEFAGCDDYTVYFDGDDDSFEIIKLAFKDTKVKLIGTNNKVVIIYSENPFNTKITVNGAAFDTTRIDNRSIDEWVKPIQIRELVWKGIFKELEENIGIGVFSIQFVGKPAFMKTLIDECPDGVDITYKVPIQGKARKPAGQGGVPKAGGAGNLASKISLPSGGAPGQMLGKMKQEISDDELNKNLDKIPIKNKFIRDNIMAICAVLSLIFAFLPFVTVSSKAGNESVGITVNGFTALVGEHGSFISVIMLLGPILVIVMNYISQLKPYRRIIAVGVPALCIIGEIVAAIVIKGSVNAGSEAVGAVGKAVGVKTETSASFGIGFWLMLVSFILTAVIGFISYYGIDQLPIKKKQ